MKILIVEDNEKLLAAIRETLEAEAYRCETASAYSEADEKLHLYDYDLLVVDINLPHGSGLDLIREAKARALRMGVIVISARNSLDNKVEGLNLGADDYLTKPFEMAELVARVKSVLRRNHFDGDTISHYGPLKIDVPSRKIWVNDLPLELTKSEFDILLFFLSNSNRVLSRESIAEHIWGDNMDLADSFDFIYSHIKNLRKKVVDSDAPNPVKAVYGIGYKLADTYK